MTHETRPGRPRPALVALALLALVAFPVAARAETILVRGATVLPMDGPAVPAADLLLEDGRVAALGPRGSFAVPEKTRVVEAAGRFVIPGLLDVHAHAADEGFLDLFLAHGVTTIRDMGNALEAVRGLATRVRESRAAGDGRHPGPEVVFVGPILDGNPPVWPAISEVVTDPSAVPALLDRLQAGGVSAFKVYERLTPPVYEAIVAEAKRRKLPVVGHVPSAVGVERCVAAGQATLEHLDHFSGYLCLPPRTFDLFELVPETLAWSDVDEAREKALIASIRASGAALDPTVLVLRTLSRLERGIPGAVPEAKYLSPLVRQAFWSFFEGRPRRPEEDASHEKAIARLLLFVKRAHAAGVPILAGSDTPNPWVVPGVSLHEELELLASVVGNEAALACATRANARALGREDLGRLSPGARADLVLLEKDPRESIAATRSIVAVAAGGVWLDRAALDGRLAALEASARAAAPATGFESLAGELAPGKPVRLPEVRLAGRFGKMPPSFWARVAAFEAVPSGTFWRARSAGSLPMPVRLDETLVTDAAGKLTRYHLARVIGGDRREVSAFRGETTFRVQVYKQGEIESEVAIPVDEYLATPGVLPWFDLAARLELEEGRATDVNLRPIDLDRALVGSPVTVRVARERPEAKALAGERLYRLTPAVAGEALPGGVQSLLVRTGPAGEPRGLELGTAFGPFAIAPEVAPPRTKRYY